MRLSAQTSELTNFLILHDFDQVSRRQRLAIRCSHSSLASLMYTQRSAGPDLRRLSFKSSSKFVWKTKERDTYSVWWVFLKLSQWDCAVHRLCFSFHLCKELARIFSFHTPFSFGLTSIGMKLVALSASSCSSVVCSSCYFTDETIHRDCSRLCCLWHYLLLNLVLKK